MQLRDEVKNAITRMTGAPTGNIANNQSLEVFDVSPSELIKELQETLGIKEVPKGWAGTLDSSTTVVDVVRIIYWASGLKKRRNA